MKASATKPRAVSSGDLTARISRGKFGEYRYRSPRFGYKKAYRYDMMIGVYYKGTRIAYFGKKYWLIRDVKVYLQDVADFLALVKRAGSLVPLYKRAKELGIDYGFVRKYRESL